MVLAVNMVETLAEAALQDRVCHARPNQTINYRWKTTAGVEDPENGYTDNNL